MDGCKMIMNEQQKSVGLIERKRGLTPTLDRRVGFLGFVDSVLSKIYACIDAASRAEFAHGPVINALHELRVGLSTEFPNISCRISRLDFVHSYHIASNA